MTKNLKTADMLVKVTLATSVIALFFGGLIAGPWALALTILSVLSLLIFATGQVLRKNSR